MITQKATVTLRPMRTSDIGQVVQIDKLSFPTPWPAYSYRYELGQSRRSQMFVLSHVASATHDRSNGRHGIRNWMGKWLDVPGMDSVIGYSGLWVLVDEVHISTVGVHPDWRGRHLGELLIFAMLRYSMQLAARVTTLEVRVSNEVAMNLYHKYGFEVVGRRPGYYRDNNEDALIMSVNSGEDAYMADFAQLGAALLQKVDVLDECRELID